MKINNHEKDTDKTVTRFTNKTRRTYIYKYIYIKYSIRTIKASSGKYRLVWFAIIFAWLFVHIRGQVGFVCLFVKRNQAFPLQVLFTMFHLPLLSTPIKFMRIKVVNEMLSQMFLPGTNFVSPIVDISSIVASF